MSLIRNIRNRLRKINQPQNSDFSGFILSLSSFRYKAPRTLFQRFDLSFLRNAHMVAIRSPNHFHTSRLWMGSSQKFFIACGTEYSVFFEASGKSSDDGEARLSKSLEDNNAGPTTKAQETAKTARAIELKAEDLEEQFVRSQGPGGQNVNKLSTCVVLRHLPTGIMVKCSKMRSQSQNRKLAREMLIDELDVLYNGELSSRVQKEIRQRKQKQRRTRRRKAKVIAVDEDDEDN
mmetsp:Transcript_23654/g.38923  ORF Transcript_23654/g.38923 Transcript_23654/m.38923 type:complete len:234 (-) Transcript_23654:124-825(-)